MANAIIYGIFGGSGFAVAVLAVVGAGLHNLFWGDHFLDLPPLRGQGQGDPYGTGTASNEGDGENGRERGRGL